MTENNLNFIKNFILIVLNVNFLIISIIYLLGILNVWEYLLWFIAPAIAFIIYGALYDFTVFIINT